MSITKSLEKAIRTIATQTAHDSPFDKTRSGVVVGYNAKENKYTITVDGVKYSNIPIVNGLMARVNDVVRVVSPNGNISQMFIYGVQTTYSALVGEIKPYAGSSEPVGWLICDGRAISRNEYQQLFDVIGTTYGAGDDSTTFNIPDLSGRTLIGVSNDYPLADARGEVEHTLNVDEMPSHNHTQDSHKHSMWNIWSDGSGGSSAYMYSSNRKLMTRETDSRTPYIYPTGGGQPHNNMQPYLAINYLIYAGGVTF